MDKMIVGGIVGLTVFLTAITVTDYFAEYRSLSKRLDLIDEIYYGIKSGNLLLIDDLQKEADMC